MRRIAACIALASAAACGLVEEKPRAEAQVAAPANAGIRSSNADELVAYLARLRGLSDNALGAEAARQRREATDLARVKAALALAVSAQSDEDDILALVNPVARRESADRELKAMAGFLQALAAERRRLKESAAAAGTRLKEERRALEAQKQRAEALQQKLDALTELEKSLSDRPVPSR